MQNIKHIYLKELRSYFNGPMAYIFLIIFSLVNGYFFSNTFFIFGQSDMRALFQIVPLVYLFFIPAITMGIISKEKNIGTMEVISTLPIKDFELVIGKYLSILSLLLVGLLLTSIMFFNLVAVGTNIDYGAVFTGYLGLFLAGSVYASMGIFASSLTDNQVVGFIIAIFFVLIFFLIDKLLIFMPNLIAGTIQYLSIDYHLSNISRGVIDSRNLIYFFSMIGMFLLLTIESLSSRKWK
jgi:ABC-2 type transport system permease protein